MKKVITVVCIALIVLSFASARIVNFGVGGNYTMYKGLAPLDEEGETSAPYSGKGLGLDSYFSLTFGDHAEIYFDDSIQVSTVNPLSDEALAPLNLTSDYEFSFLLNYVGRVGYQHAILLDPVKLSVGAGLAIQLLAVSYTDGDIKADYEARTAMVASFGVNVTAKVEVPLVRHLSLYVKGDFDYYPGTVYAGTYNHYPTTQEGDGTLFANGGQYKNFSAAVSGGLVLYF